VNLRLLVGVPLVGLIALIIGQTWSGPLGIAAVVAISVVAALALDAVEARRVRALAESVNAWVGYHDHRPVQLRGNDAWRKLGIALNALGAAYHRRGSKLERERPWRRELVDSLVQPALLFSGEGRMLAANDAARKLLGIPIDAWDLTVVQAVGSVALARAVEQAATSEAPVTVDVERGHNDLRAVVSLVGDETLLIIEDRTRERRVEELRRNFVVNASHELKTPVTSIQTLAEALQVTMRNDPDRTANLVSRLGVEAERLARLVHDLLDLRRLEERGPLERVPVDLAELVRLTVAELIPRAESREVTVGVDAPDHATVGGVPGDLEVIVKNLVSNAVQYNRPGGTVEVTIERRGGFQVMCVTDTGLGIPQQNLTRMFERFYRVDAARSRETGGTGLGLSIVRHAVERHGGNIRVDSLLGEGTTFTVTLPIEAPR
jgi:two-component system, OmpR family, phosphate regulon sensor histidine kinase PhoR